MTSPSMLIPVLADRRRTHTRVLYYQRRTIAHDLLEAGLCPEGRRFASNARSRYSTGRVPIEGPLLVTYRRPSIWLRS